MQAGGPGAGARVTLSAAVEVLHQGPHELILSLQAKAGDSGVSVGKNEQSQLQWAECAHVPLW